MKRIAYCISGELRFFDFSFKLMNKLKEYLNSEGIVVDFFLATWDYHNYLIDDKFFIDIKEVDVNSIYAPNNYYKWSYLFQMSQHTRNVYEKNNNVKYHAVIWSRPDLWLRKYFLDEILSLLNNEGISFLHNSMLYNNSGIRSMNNSEIDITTDDNLLIGSPVAMNIFNSIYNKTILIDGRMHQTLAKYSIENGKFIKNSHDIRLYKIIRDNNIDVLKLNINKYLTQ